MRFVMKVKSIINTQIEFVEDMSEEDFKMFNNSSNKNKVKSIIQDILLKSTKADNVIVKSYRIEKEKTDESTN
jgi:hypothetical protein